jgi:hypothetical protein
MTGTARRYRSVFIYLFISCLNYEAEIVDGAKLYKVASQILHICTNEISLLSICIAVSFLSFVLALCSHTVLSIYGTRRTFIQRVKRNNFGQCLLIVANHCGGGGCCFIM